MSASAPLVDIIPFDRRPDFTQRQPRKGPRIGPIAIPALPLAVTGLLTPSPSGPLPDMSIPTATPPYTSSEDLAKRQSQRPPVFAHRSDYGLMPPPTGYSPHYISGPSSGSSSAIPMPAAPVYAISPSARQQRPSPSQHFAMYPHSYPTNPYFLDQRGLSGPAWLPSTDDEPQSVMDFDTETNYEDFGGGMTTDTEAPPDRNVLISPSKPDVSRPQHTPRPPNAWILYRSVKLKAIAAGEDIPGLDDLMAEAGVSGSGSSADDSAIEVKRSAKGKGKAKGDMPPPSALLKKAKGKKGVKEPTEHMLALGRGKTGRGIPQADISKMISMLWKRESAEVRAEYERMSNTRKLEHQEKYPGYKFQPLRKADKLRMREEREREKELVKREKEMQRSGGRGKKTRSRTRFSPTSPYSTLATGKPVFGTIGRSLSYAGTSGHLGPEIMPGGSGSFSSPHGITPRDRALSDQEHGYRSYPFPMPPGSLPALHPDDHAGNNPFSDDSSHESAAAGPQAIDPRRQTTRSAEPGSVYRHVSALQLPSRSEDTRSTPAPPSPPPSPRTIARGTVTQSERRAGDQALGHPFDPLGLEGMPLDVFASPPPSFGAYPGGGTAYAVPYLFEPIPLPGDPIGALDNLPERQHGASVDPASLAAMWCLLEEENPPLPLPSPGARASQIPDPLDNVYSVWNMHAEEALARWGQPAVSAESEIFDSLQLTSSVGARIAADWAASHSHPTGDLVQSVAYYGHQPGQNPTQISRDEISALYPPGTYVGPYLYPNTPYLQYHYYDPALYPPGTDIAPGTGGEGPILSAQALSPPESWSTNTTPRDSSLHPLRQQQERMASTYLSGERRSSALQSIPRHISASSYPLTPLSVDPSGLGGHGWSTPGGRQPSVSQVLAEADVEREYGGDIMGWDEGSRQVSQASPPVQDISGAGVGQRSPRYERDREAKGGPERGQGYEGDPARFQATPVIQMAPRARARPRQVGKQFDSGERGDTEE